MFWGNMQIIAHFFNRSLIGSVYFFNFSKRSDVLQYGLKP